MSCRDCELEAEAHYDYRTGVIGVRIVDKSPLAQGGYVHGLYLRISDEVFYQYKIVEGQELVHKSMTQENIVSREDSDWEQLQLLFEEHERT